MIIKIGSDNTVKTNDEVVILESPCQINHLNMNNDNYLFIDDLIINENGFINQMSLSIDEILITIPIKLIIAKYYSTKLEEISNFYKIPFISIYKT